MFKEVQQRMFRGIEFHSLGAATEKALSPAAVEVLGIARRYLSADLRLRHDEYGVRSSLSAFHVSSIIWIAQYIPLIAESYRTIKYIMIKRVRNLRDIIT